MNRWDRHIAAQMVLGFPSLTIFLPKVRAFAAVPPDLEQGMYHMIVKQKLLSDAVMKVKWWDRLRHDPKAKPKDLPVHITVRYPPDGRGAPEVTAHEKYPSWYTGKGERP